MKALEAIVIAVIVLAPAVTVCYGTWRAGRALRIVEPDSLVFPCACVAVFLPGAWFAWAAILDTLHVVSSTAGIAIFILMFIAPVIAFIGAVLFAGPVTLAANVPAVGRQLRTSPPGVLANAAAVIGLALLVAAGLKLMLPLYRMLDVNLTARAASTPKAELMRLSRRAGRDHDVGLAHMLMYNPAMDDELYAALTGDCMADSVAEGCKHYLLLLMRHRGIPAQVEAEIRDLYRLRRR